MVTITQVAQVNYPRFAIGSVNLAEFFVALATSLTFFGTIGLSQCQTGLGLITGRILAATIATYLTNKLPLRFLMGLVGVAIVLLSLRNFYLAFFEQHILK